MRIKRFICVLVLAAFTCFSVGGCYGKYALFNSAHKFGGNLGGKWIGAVVNLVFWGVGVYGICLVADLLIFNTLEFWTGSNPVAMGNTYEGSDTYGNRVYALKNPDGTLSVELTDAGGKKADFMLVRNGNLVKMVNAKGIVIAQQVVEE
jgi:hypothetical protein